MPRTEENNRIPIQCCGCGASRPTPVAKSGAPRTPRGWKVIHGEIYCPTCKLQKYALRAVSIPVANCDWGRVRPALRSAWRDVAQCSNWLMTQYYAGDRLSASNSEKIPKWNISYLYPAARAAFPAIEPQTLTSIINTIQAKYRAMRFDLWRHKSSLPTFRSVPVPINRQSWKIGKDRECWQFSFRYSKEWHTLVLRGGGQFHRQHRAFEQILCAEAEAGEAALYEKGNSLMLKIAAWFPRGEQKDTRGAAKARTAADAFLIATGNERVWRLNGDHVLRWIVGAQKQQQRLREDMKAERRFPKPMRAGIMEKMYRLSHLRKNRLDSWMHEASAQLVNWTARQRLRELIWDDTYPSMMPSFPWHTFAQRLEDKCEAAGITFSRSSEGALLESPETLAKVEKN